MIEAPVETPLRWTYLPYDKDIATAKRRKAMRLNSLADPYFFGKVVLRQNRLVSHLHGRWLNRLSDPNLHLVLQAPRDHLKTSSGTLTLPIWWSLPFEDREEDWMRALGYGDEWIRYMRRIHSRNLRTMVATETEPNAVKIGIRFDNQYQKNQTFRYVFSDLIPEGKETWNQLVKTQRRDSAAGEGTYNFFGVGTALQSNHFDRAIEDDLFGEDALYSESTREQTIEWHQKLPGAFDTDFDAENQCNLELIIGNRWGIHDLNGWIKDNNPTFEFETHSAEGGCCELHPAGQPIFPEEFTMERLNGLRVRFGTRSYSAHYLNNPLTEEECSFRVGWLPRFRLQKKNAGMNQDGTPIQKTFIEMIARDKDSVEEDVEVATLERLLILDPNHGGERGRARHAITVIGWHRVKGKKRIYLLESWAGAVSHDSMVGEAAKLAARWHVQKFYVETIAGQDGWLFYFERELRDKLPQTVIQSLPKERGSGAKERRILSMSPLYERGQVCVRNSGGGSEEFMKEYEYHPQSKTVDLLDCMGYVFNLVEQQEVDPRQWRSQMERDMERRRRSVGRAGY